MLGITSNSLFILLATTEDDEIADGERLPVVPQDYLTGSLYPNLRNKAIGQPIELCLICHQNGILCRWSDSGNLILVACEESAYVLSYNAQVNRRIQKGRMGIKLDFCRWHLWQG
eukprot:scaffold2969_cov50-Cyclotella_meneghiniana.AAC.2